MNEMVGLDCGAAAERMAGHRVGREAVMREHPNITGDYDRGCIVREAGGGAPREVLAGWSRDPPAE
jgi:hypothetical protein